MSCDLKQSGDYSGRNPTSHKTLIFPALNQAARDYFYASGLDYESVIAAASIYDQEAASYFGELSLLPFIYDADFIHKLTKLVDSNNIRRIYAPLSSVHAFIENLIFENKLDLQLVGKSPITREVEAYHRLITTAAETVNHVESISKSVSYECSSATLSLFDIAAILKQANAIYGESNDEKISAMMAIFSSAPKGDVIEIGSSLGRTAFVLLYLARHYEIGNVLAVDPWSAEASEQNGSPETIRKTLVNQWDYTMFPGAFIVNMLPFGKGKFNFLRMKSEDASGYYQSQSTVTSPNFGEVSYTGEISVIHIDGNHDYDQVSIDCELWLKRLARGGWVVLDDYLWAHGNGPQRMGDLLLEARRESIDCAFVCGKALFIRFC